MPTLQLPLLYDAFLITISQPLSMEDLPPYGYISPGAVMIPIVPVSSAASIQIPHNPLHVANRV